MGRLVTLDQYLNALAEKTVDNSRQLKRGVHQRRNGMEDLYGICFSANGDANNPAKFYISISPDMVYLERFAFKFVIKPYTSSVAGVSGGSLQIGETSLSGGSGGEQIATGTSTLEDLASGGITPNPHTHTASGSIDGVSYGVHKIDTTSKNWEVHIDGIDISDYLKAQHDGDWLGDKGQGVYPTSRLRSIHDFYDILEVADMMTDEGRTEERDKILSPEFKPIEIFSDAPFGADAYLYLKYSNLNR